MGLGRMKLPSLGLYVCKVISAITEGSFAMIKATFALAIAAVLIGGTARATTYYYDTSASPGLGGTPPIGSWASGVNAEWTTDPTGSTVPTTASWGTGTFNDAVFDGTAAAITITASPGVFANSITVNQNGYSFTGGLLTLENQAKIVVASGKTVSMGSTMAGTAGYNISGGGTFNITGATGTITGPVSVTGGSTLELVSSGAIGGTAAGRRRRHA